MRLRENIRQIIRVLLLAFMLSAVSPFGGYNPRLELSYPTETLAAKSQAAPSDGKQDWLLFLFSERTVVVSVPTTRHEQESHHQTGRSAALFYSRNSLEFADPDPQIRAEYANFIYTSPTALQPAERGPPYLV